MSEGEYEPFELQQPEIAEDVLEKLGRIDSERKLALSRALIEQTAKTLDQTRQLVGDVPHFWAFSLLQHVVLKEACSAKHDIQALSYLSNIELKQSVNDPRPFELVFHFAENPYFTNTTLTKTYSLQNGEQPPADEEALVKAMQEWQPLDLDASPAAIDWKEGQNLIEKYPRNVHSDGDFEGDSGSFFHYFTEVKDPQSIGILLQTDILPELFNYYNGEGENCEGSYSDLEDELDEETGDEEEIDLEAEEENAKKRRRT